MPGLSLLPSVWVSLAGPFRLFPFSMRTAPPTAFRLFLFTPFLALTRFHRIWLAGRSRHIWWRTDQQPSYASRSIAQTFRSRVSFTMCDNILSNGAGMTPFFASVFAMSDSDVALHAAAEAGSRSTFSTAAGQGPRRGVPCHGAGTDKFGEEQRCRSSGGRRHATGRLGTDAPCPGAARAGTAFGETSCARGARVPY